MTALGTIVTSVIYLNNTTLFALSQTTSKTLKYHARITTMRQSQLFTKTRREAPSDEVAKNSQLLIRAGFIQKMTAGVYSFLPLGLRVLNKIENIIREEMNAIGGQELRLAALQEKSLWEKTNRWDDAVVDNWFKTTLKNGNVMGLGFSHEEPLTDLLRDHLRSFRDLPIYPYQFQTKFRNEMRAKSGILRGREFLMKDMYSFSKNEKEHDDFYEKAKIAYTNIFRRAGIGDRTYITFASGGSFSKYSHEFQMLTDAGEDIIYYNADKKIAINKEICNSEGLKDGGFTDEQLTEAKSIEIANIFGLGTRFSEAIDLKYKDAEGTSHFPIMGCYGIGVPRLMGSIVEALGDDKGIVWPAEVSPFAVHIIAMKTEGVVIEAAEKLYKELIERGIEVLLDDRDARAGEKFGDADLIGIPLRITIGEKSIAEGKYEFKDRIASKDELFDKDQLMAYIGKHNV